jgi:hypothetical protein
MNELSARNRWFGSGAFTISSAKDFKESCCFSNCINSLGEIYFPAEACPRALTECRLKKESSRKEYFFRVMDTF